MSRAPQSTSHLGTEIVETFQRCPHDRENPYAQISRELIRDKSISPQCRWFIIYCLSFDKNWKISIPYFMKEQEISKDRMYSIVDEAIESGYIKRDMRIESGLKKYSYIISESPKFKKCLPCPENPDPENQDTTNKQPLRKKEKPPTPLKSKLPNSQKKEGVFSKESLKKQMTNVSDQDFVLAWKEYQKAPPGSVKNIKRWIPAVVKRIQFERAIQEETEKRIEKHKKQAEERETVNIVACPNHLEFTHGSYIKVVDYLVSDEEWEKQTGWKPLE